jgi:hypothetical protein
MVNSKRFCSFDFASSIMSSPHNPLLTLAAAVAEEVVADELGCEEELNFAAESEDEEEESIILGQLKTVTTIEANNTTMVFTNLAFNKLMALWQIGADEMTTAWSGRGRKSKIGAFDAFYFLLYHYKRGKEPKAIASEFQRVWAPAVLSKAAVCFI